MGRSIRAASMTSERVRLDDFNAIAAARPDGKRVTLDDLGDGDCDSLVVVPLSAFIACDEETPEALLGTDDENVLPAGGDMIVFGAGGASKTTLLIDQAVHMAAGIDWLGFEVARPVRVLILENEGPRAQFRRKLAKKVSTSDGPPFAGNLFVYEHRGAASRSPMTSCAGGLPR
jgi:hypothetical protein